jgi:hypothetical protein
MGFYLRKAFRIGPLRLNLSRSGIGLSAGVRGARVGVGPRGSYLHAGREGIYYRKTLGRSRRRARSGVPVTVSFNTAATQADTPLFSTFLRSMTRALALRRLAWLLFSAGLLTAFIHPGFLLLTICGLGSAYAAGSAKQAATRAVHEASVAPPPVLGFLALVDDRAVDLVSLDARPARVDGDLVVFDGGFLRFLPGEIWFAVDGVFAAVRSTPGRPTRLLVREPLPGLEVIGEAYRYERRDGGPDRRYAENVRLVETSGLVTRLVEGYAIVTAVV